MRMILHSGFISPETGLGSPGHDGLKFLKPVRPGDTLKGTLEVTDVRISRSKPDLGLVTTIATLRNQRNEEVYWLKSISLIKART
jgi:acyl dehydratase